MADLDIEPVRRDGSDNLWFGDEFGAFLLHADATGYVIERDNPERGEARSKKSTWYSTAPCSRLALVHDTL